MTEFSMTQFIFVVLTAIILFLYGLEQFSREVHRLGATHFNEWLTRVADNRFTGLFLGAGLTAIIQSSSAVTAITVALVHSGVLTLAQSLGIILGANVGTTLTAQLVALDAMKLGPFFIVIGFVLSLVRFRYSLVGKSIFYFGFIFFSLDLISQSLAPVKQDPRVLELLGSSTSVVVAALIGVAVTAVLQSSSVTTGLTIVLVHQGSLALEPALGIVLGANIGTTTTGLLASIKMNASAKRTAVANLIVNFVGVLAFLPLTDELLALGGSFVDTPARAVANAHFVFNLGVALIGLPLIWPLARLVERLVPDSPPQADTRSVSDSVARKKDIKR